MRLSVVRDYFRLRRHLESPWAFLRSRKRPLPDGYEDVSFRAGFAVRVRDRPMERHIFHRIFARDEYRLDGVGEDSWDTVIDVGAHAGFFAVRVAPLARRVLSYEPADENFRLLEHNTSRPRFAHVTAHRRAVAARAGAQTLYLSDNPAAHSVDPGHLVGSAPITDARPSEVEAVTLEEVFAAHEVQRCDLLKLDCEGAEWEVLTEMPAALWDRIVRIYLEYHAPPPHLAEWTSEALEELLTGRGYVCERFPSKRHASMGHMFATRPG